MKAWYFSQENKRLRYGDGRVIRPGITHKVKFPYYNAEDDEFYHKPSLCCAGVHGSIRPLDALSYAPGPVVWRVELSGDVVCEKDKCVAAERKYLWGYDATEVLRKFARMCALDVIHPLDAPKVVVDYLKTGDDSLRKAARKAAWGAARKAAWGAAMEAARGAAWGAAMGAARGAARGAAWGAAREAARKKQNERLYRMLMDGRITC